MQRTVWSNIITATVTAIITWLATVAYAVTWQNEFSSRGDLAAVEARVRNVEQILPRVEAKLDAVIRQLERIQ